MRVIAGRWRGRVLKSPRTDAVRPTTDRVKEAMFSIVGSRITGAVFVDLCCGAGGLAIEALSRGARRAILVDTSRASLDLARANLELCGAESASFELVRGDCLRWLESWTPPAAPWLLAADPPYRSDLPWAILDKVRTLASAEGFQLAMVEHESTSRPPGDDDLESRRYGQSTLTLVRPQQPQPEDKEIP
jgi:16S rRNA (guanine966-N2)-methyltransferase